MINYVWFSINFQTWTCLQKRDLISASPIFCIFFVMRPAHCLKMLIISPGKEPRCPSRVNKSNRGCIPGRPHLRSRTSSHACGAMRLRDGAGSSTFFSLPQAFLQRQGGLGAASCSALCCWKNAAECENLSPGWSHIHLSLLSVSCRKISQGLENSSHKNGI